MRILLFMLVLLLLAGPLLTGCSKDGILDVYDGVVQVAGNLGLTSSLTLKGERTFGEDRYTGTYESDYVNFTGQEALFGGTALKWRSREALTVTCTLKPQSGTAVLQWNCGADEPVVLAQGEGTFSQTVYLAPGSNYFDLICEDFTGSVDLKIE